MPIRRQDFRYDTGESVVYVEWHRGRDGLVQLSIINSTTGHLSYASVSANEAKEIGYALLFVAGEGDDNAN